MLNSGISNIKVFACNSNKTLAEAIAKKLNLKLGDCEVEKFSGKNPQGEPSRGDGG